jgi:hypothetical protein
MAASDDRLPSIDKLDETNWPVWKLQIRTYLEARELWSLCTGDETEPVDHVDDETSHAAFVQQQAKYQVRVARVKSILLQMVSTAQLHVIAQQRLRTPRDMWKELTDTFERPSLSNKLQLLTRLLDTQMESGSCVDDYFRDLQDLTERLAALGSPVETDFQVALALRGLPTEYDALRVAFVTKGTVTMAELREALRTEERRLYPNVKSVGASAGSSGTSVLTARGVDYRFDKGKHQMHNSFGSCYGCGKFGHKHKDCPTNPYVPKTINRRAHNVKKAEYFKNDENDKTAQADKTSNAMFTALYGTGTVSSSSRDIWIIDSGATKHMSPYLDTFCDYVPFCVAETVLLGNGSRCEAKGIGRVAVNVLLDNVVKQYVLSDVLYVPHLVNNFFSVTVATLKGHELAFKQDLCRISRDAKLIATGYRVDNLWCLDCLPTEVCVSLKGSQTVDELTLWHRRLGHVHEKRLKYAVSKGLIIGVDLADGQLPFCEACVQGKQTRKPFNGTADVQTKGMLQLVHSDVCGPMSVASLGGARYFVTFTDDYTRYSSVYFLRQKSEVFSKFKEFAAEVTNATGLKIKTLRTDNGGEYTSNEFELFLKENGIRHEVTAPYTPQQNGVSERLNRTIQEMALSQLLHAGLPKCFWAESVAAACYVRNRLPVCPVDVSPYERWYARKPSVRHLRVFGCIAYALKPNLNRVKMDARSEKLRFVGYCLNSKGYRLYDEKRRRLVVRRDVVFNETDFVFEKSHEANPADVTEIVGVDEPEPEFGTPSIKDASQESVIQPDIESHEQNIRRSNRIVKKPDRFGEWIEESELKTAYEHIDNANHMSVDEHRARHSLPVSS